MAPVHFILYLIIFLYGIVIGSFLNVCIYRMPKGENLVTVGSHCMECGHHLKWYDLFPLFSWLFLRGKCRYCGAGISVQYPLVEALNGVLYVLVFAIKGWNADSILWCILVSALIVLSVIDHRTMMIPTAVDVVILLVGILHLILHLNDWVYYVTGFISASLFLLLCAFLFRAVTGKGGLGMGDVELMACAGLCLGWGHSLFAVVVGSVLGAIVQGIRMAVTKERGKFPFGPYLSIGVFVALLWGTQLYEWYLESFLFM